MLQAYATLEILRGLGFDPIFLNYHHPWSFGLNEKDWHSYIGRSVKTTVDKWHTLWRQRSLKKNFSPMWDMFPLTQYYGTSLEAIMKNPPECDIYVTGSDQTWNTNGDISHFGAYLLPFGSKSIPRVSIAPSLGGNKFNDAFLDWIRKCLSNYKAISVREKQDLEYFKSQGFKDVCHVTDPTILADKQIYDNLITAERHTKYDIVTYILGGGNTQHISHICNACKNIAKNRSSNIFNISLHGIKVKGAENGIVTVPSFVDRIANCGILITNSFHGVVFANIYKRPYVYLKFDDEKRNARVQSLLEGSDEEFRMIPNGDEFMNNPERFYSQPILDLLTMRENGLEFIRKNLNK